MKTNRDDPGGISGKTHAKNTSGEGASPWAVAAVLGAAADASGPVEEVAAAAGADVVVDVCFFSRFSRGGFACTESDRVLLPLDSGVGLECLSFFLLVPFR